MYWIYLIIGLSAITAAFFVPQIWLLLLLLCVSCVFILLSAHAWYSQRVGSQHHDLSNLIDPAELENLRKRADARNSHSLSGSEDN